MINKYTVLSATEVHPRHYERAAEASISCQIKRESSRCLTRHFCVRNIRIHGKKLEQLKQYLHSNNTVLIPATIRMKFSVLSSKPGHTILKHALSFSKHLKSFTLPVTIT
jgi:hypothetical protein